MVTKEQRVHKSSVATITKESRFHQALGLHLRRKCILLVNTFLNHRSVFKTIGWFNRRWRFLETLFVAYPASDDYTRAYVCGDGHSHPPGPGAGTGYGPVCGAALSGTYFANTSLTYTCPHPGKHSQVPGFQVCHAIITFSEGDIHTQALCYSPPA
jgi:hypothetical protein